MSRFTCRECWLGNHEHKGPACPEMNGDWQCDCTELSKSMTITEFMHKMYEGFPDDEGVLRIESKAVWSWSGDYVNESPGVPTVYLNGEAVAVLEYWDGNIQRFLSYPNATLGFLQEVSDKTGWPLEKLIKAEPL